MATLTGKQLAQNIRKRIDELKEVCQGVDEGTASRTPPGRWSPKEILSHLLGPEETPPLLDLQAFLDKETPRLDIEPAKSFLSEERFKKSFAELLSQVATEYERICRFASGLSEKQLARKAQIPMLRDTPFGEYQTLAAWLDMLGGMEESHLAFHTNHMREILRELGVASK
jgi:hypothetical protein